jgi:hypothetical protein
LHTSELLSFNVIDLRLQNLIDLYHKYFIDNDEFLLSIGANVLEIKDLKRLQDTFNYLCMALQHFNIPQTLDHGDFHLLNVVQNSYKFTIIDFGDSAITHPFFSIIFFLDILEMKLNLTQTSKEYNLIKDCYLKEWLEYARIEECHQALYLARIIFSFLLFYHHLRVSSAVSGSSIYDQKMLDEGIKGLIKFMNMFNDGHPRLNLSNY